MRSCFSHADSKGLRTEEAYPHLFTPIKLGTQLFRNRIALGALYTGRARNPEMTTELVRFYANRAAGGAALVVTEAISALRKSSANIGQLSIYQRRDLETLKLLVHAVHKHDSGIVAQLQEPGRGDTRPQRKPFSLAPSALPDDLSWTMPRPMTIQDIAEMREDFVAAAQSLHSVGFNGVELSCGHGHLHHQFLSPWMNHREDEYGGTRENRIRVIVELLHAIRQACGESFLIGLRLPGDDGIPGSIDWEEAGQIADSLTQACRPDYVNFVQGGQASTLFMHVPDMHEKRGTYVETIGMIRSRCNGVPVAATGRILEPVQAETLLASGRADFVMMGRTLLADAAWGLKARTNRDGDIRKCVSCNSCWGEVARGGPLGCDNNPRVARKDEVDWWPKATVAPRRVTVVGGGIAGLETAWVAAAGGHHVTLFSQSSELGGKARLYASVPGCEAFSSIFDYQITAARRAHVEFELSCRATIEDIERSRPDIVVLATGAEMLWPAQLPSQWQQWGIIPDLWTTIGELGRLRKEEGAAVLYDFEGTDVTYSVAEALSRHFKRVVIVNPVECLGRDEALVKRQAIYCRLVNSGVEILSWSEPSANTDLENGRVSIRNIMSGAETVIENVSLFTYATPRRQRDELLIPLRDRDCRTYIIGDAYIPRSTMAIIREAHDLGETICSGVLASGVKKAESTPGQWA